MDELQKINMRNYCMAAGFLIIAAQFLIRIIGSFFSQNYELIVVPAMKGIMPIILFGIIAVSIILIILKNRDLAVMTFLMFGLYDGFIYIVEGSTSSGSIIIGMFSMILALMIIISKYKAKYPLFIIPALLGFSLFFAPVIGTDSPIIIVIRLLLTLICIYYAFACVSEKAEFPFSEMLKSDSENDFKVFGSALGYLLIGITSASLAVCYISDGILLSTSVCESLLFCCSLLLIIIGIMLFIIGKMQFTPILFLISGILIFMTIYVSGVMIAGVAAMFVITGLLTVLRKEARILPSFIMILFGIAAYSSIFGSFAILSGCLYLLPAIIAVYLCLGLISGYKLPLV